MAGSRTNKQIHELVSTLEAMLRVVTPDHPFQPVLAAAIDPHAWQAVFVDRCKELVTACGEAQTDDSLRRACDELHDFAATLFGDSYFDHFHAAENPDRDATEFGPDAEFFENNPRWLKAKRESRPHNDLIQSRLTALKDRWESSCRKLANSLEIGKYASVLPAVLEIARRVQDQPPPDTVTVGPINRQHVHEPGLDCLSPAAPAPHNANLVRFQRKRAEVFVSDIFLPSLDDGVSTAFPEKGRSGRKTRQEANKRLGKAASDVLACAHLQWAWETLQDHATTTTALHTLLTAVSEAMRPPKPNRNPEESTRQGLPLLESLRQIPRDVLDTSLSRRWDEHLKDPSQMETVKVAIQLLAHGHTYVGQNQLAKQLQANAKDDDPSGWEDKAEERLRKLGNDTMAIHGSENWIRQPIGVSRSKEFRAPRKGYGWLVNPLLVLWDPVYKAL